MSAKNRKTKSDQLDRYYTPRWVTDQAVDLLIDHLGFFGNEPGCSLEPCVGTGSFDKAMTVMPNMKGYTIDIDPEAYAMWTGDYLKELPPPHWPGFFDLIITNPPYFLAEEFARKALTHARHVVFLLRLNWLASKKRTAFFAEHKPTDIFVLPKRPSFRADGKTDATDYCFVCWDSKDLQAMTRLRWLPIPDSIY